MASRKQPTTDSKPRTKPAITQDDRENQIISAAYNLVEERILNGTASSQETTFFLKLGSSKERLEKEKLELEKSLLEAKTKAIEASKEFDKKYEEAIRAMREYQGISDEPSEDVF